MVEQVERDFYLVLTVTVPSVRKEGKEGEQVRLLASN